MHQKQKEDLLACIYYKLQMLTKRCGKNIIFTIKDISLVVIILDKIKNEAGTCGIKKTINQSSARG
jgi:hypothetical protein